ncbi:transposable element Tc1 transposase [Trichonephila clavipes]|nr:transposable element Tc1 transposase [Trichonephila clavipes]
MARRKPYILVTNLLKWIAFSKEHKNKPPVFWRIVIFSDESKFCIFGIKGRKLIWRKPCTALQKEHLVPPVKHGGGEVMICGCTASNGVGKIRQHNIFSNDMLKNVLKEQWEKVSAEKKPEDLLVESRNDFKRFPKDTPF